MLPSLSQKNIFTLLDQAANSGGNFLVTLFVARVLDAAGFGVYSVGLLLGMLSMEICQATIAAPAQSIGPKLPDDLFPGYCRTTAYLSAILGMATCLAVLVGTALYGLFFRIEPGMAQGPLYALAAVGMQQHLWARRMAYVAGKNAAAFTGSACRYVLHGIFVFFIWRFGSKNSAGWQIAALGSCGLIGAALTTSLWRSSHGSSFSIFSAVRRHWDIGKWLTGSVALNWFGSNWFVVVAGTALGAPALGALRAAQNVTGVGGVFVQMMENVIPIRAAQRQAREGNLSAFRYIIRIGTLAIGACSAICAFLVVFAAPIMGWLYGDEYRRFGIVLALLSVTFVISLTTFLLKVLFRTVEKVRPVFLAQVVVAILTILCAGPLVNRYGVAGAAFGLLAVQFVTASYLSISARHLFRRT